MHCPNLQNDAPGSIAVIGKLVDLAVDLLADLCVTVVTMPPKKKTSPW